jgi:uncharacterized damage-inducible protein DinB
MDLRDWRNALGWGLSGFGSHIEPLRAVKGLDAGGAAQVPAGGLHSAHQAGLERAQGLARSADLTVRIPAWGPEMTAGAALTVLITHNSYHIAQLVDARKATGNWPPPKD